MPKQAKRWERIPVQFTPAQYEYLRRKSFDERTPIAALIRSLVEAMRRDEDRSHPPKASR